MRPYELCLRPIPNGGLFFAYVQAIIPLSIFSLRLQASSMRRLFTFFALLGLLLAPPLGDQGAASAQHSLLRAVTSAASDTLVLDRIESGFRTGNPAVLLIDAAEPIDLAIYGHGASFSRSQAALVLLDFFRRYPPGEVSFREEVSAANRRSIVGQYREAGATEASAIFVRMRARNDRWEIRSIRIERPGRR
jgi:hypothetical protein